MPQAVVSATGTLAREAATVSARHKSQYSQQSQPCKSARGPATSRPRESVRTSRFMRLTGRMSSRGARKPPYPLTSREIEVLTWVARGKSAWEIGEILDIAKRTVDEHVQTAVKKIGAANRTNAVAIAVRDRIIDA